jgi:hypothetical protein
VGGKGKWWAERGRNNQTLYAHMNKRNKKNLSVCKETIRRQKVFPPFLFRENKNMILTHSAFYIVYLTTALFIDLYKNEFGMFYL